MVFNESTNYDLMSLASKAAPSWYIQLNMFLNISGGIARLLSPLLWDQLQDLSASLRNKSCKRMASRRKRSIKPCYYTNRTIKETCMLTRLRTGLLELENHAGFAKLTRWIMKTQHSNIWLCTQYSLRCGN